MTRRWLSPGVMFVLALYVAPACKHDNPVSQEDWVNMAGLIAADCFNQAAKPQANRSFTTSFENQSEFTTPGFYVVPQNYQSAATHQLSTAQVHSGTSAHQGSIYAKGPSCPFWQNCNHRGYPTIQLQKLAAGGYSGTVLIEFWVYLTGVTIGAGEWFSFATLSADPGDSWSRVVLVNIGPINGSSQSYLHLMHVPLHGQNGWTYQDTSTPFPMNQWNKISVCLNLHPASGSAKAFLWPNGVGRFLASSASVQGGCGILQQAHFGLYAPPTLTTGTVYNDDLTIQEVSACPY